MRWSFDCRPSALVRLPVGRALKNRQFFSRTSHTFHLCQFKHGNRNWHFCVRACNRIRYVVPWNAVEYVWISRALGYLWFGFVDPFPRCRSGLLCAADLIIGLARRVNIVLAFKLKTNLLVWKFVGSMICGTMTNLQWGLASNRVLNLVEASTLVIVKHRAAGAFVFYKT